MPNPIRNSTSISNRVVPWLKKNDPTLVVLHKGRSRGIHSTRVCFWNNNKGWIWAAESRNHKSSTNLFRSFPIQHELSSHDYYYYYWGFTLKLEQHRLQHLKLMATSCRHYCYDCCSRDVIVVLHFHGDGESTGIIISRTTFTLVLQTFSFLLQNTIHCLFYYISFIWVGLILCFLWCVFAILLYLFASLSVERDTMYLSGSFF